MLSNNNDYSDKEKAMFRIFGIQDVLMEGDCSVPAPMLYRMAVERVFLGDMKGPAVESLRRCYQALNKCKIYRMTPEWEAFIQLD